MTRRSGCWAYLSYRRFDKGRTSGSCAAFLSDERAAILLHKPHPRNDLLEYQVKQLLDILEQEGLV